MPLSFFFLFRCTLKEHHTQFRSFFRERVKDSVTDVVIASIQFGTDPGSVIRVRKVFENPLIERTVVIDSNQCSLPFLSFFLFFRNITLISCFQVGYIGSGFNCPSGASKVLELLHWCCALLPDFVSLTVEVIRRLS